MISAPLKSLFPGSAGLQPGSSACASSEPRPPWCCPGARTAGLEPGGPRGVCDGSDAVAAHRNPFRTERLEALRYRLDDAGWAALLARGGALGWRCALVGPEGSGKTTLLGELERRLATSFPVQARLTARRGAPPARADQEAALAALPPGGLLTIDGAEQYGRLGWWRLTRRWRGALVATSHRPGLLPTLRTHTTDAGLLGELVRELGGAEIAVEELWRRHRGNLRTCLLECYDRCAHGV